MKKLFSLLALTLVCAITFAASITAPNVDFGTISIKGKQKPVTGSQAVVVTWSGLASDGATMWAEISEGAVDDETNPNGFYVSDPDYVYLGYGDKMISSCSFNVSYMVKEAGTFTGKLHLYSYDTSWEQVDAYAEKVIEHIIANGKKTAQGNDDEDIISRMVNYDPEAETETAYTREDALRLLSGVDLRDHIMTTTPAGLAELLLL